MMAVLPVELINKLFHDVIQNAKNIGDLMKEMSTIDEIWYMLVSLVLIFIIPQMATFQQIHQKTIPEHLNYYLDFDVCPSFCLSFCKNIS